MEENAGKNNKIRAYAGIIFGITLTIAIIFLVSSLLSGPHDQFAKCLTSKGITFYGAFWCPHCAEEKQLFGNSMKYVNYTECSTPDFQRTPVCIDANITAYPTWQFENGSRISQVLSLQALSTLSGCNLEKS